MTIDGVDILNEYGIKLTKEQGLDDLPARKKTLSETGFDDKDIVYEALTPTLVLFGKFIDTTTMISKLKAFETFFKSGLKHVYADENRGWSFTAACPDGIGGIYDPAKRYCILTLKVEITE